MAILWRRPRASSRQFARPSRQPSSKPIPIDSRRTVSLSFLCSVFLLLLVIPLRHIYFHVQSISHPTILITRILPPTLSHQGLPVSVYVSHILSHERLPAPASNRKPPIQRHWHIHHPLNISELQALSQLLSKHSESFSIRYFPNVSIPSPAFQLAIHALPSRLRNFSRDALRSPVFRKLPSDTNSLLAATSVLRALFSPHANTVLQSARVFNHVLDHVFTGTTTQFALVIPPDVILSPTLLKVLTVLPRTLGNRSVSIPVTASSSPSPVNNSIPIVDSTLLLLHRSVSLRANESLLFPSEVASEMLQRILRSQSHLNVSNSTSLSHFHQIIPITNLTPPTSHLHAQRILLHDSHPFYSRYIPNATADIAHRNAMYQYTEAHMLYNLHTLSFLHNLKLNSTFNPLTTTLLFNSHHLQLNIQLFHANTSSSLRNLVHRLTTLATEELDRSPAVYSVTHKEELPPSGNKHDYLSWTPYLWPILDNRTEGAGRSAPRFEVRDGKRAPGTALYDEQSNRFDRTRLADFNRNVTILVLASVFTQRQDFAKRAVSLVRAWFLDDSTRMTPHLKYGMLTAPKQGAQVVGGRPYSGGVIDGLGIAVVFDAMRLLHHYHPNAMSTRDMHRMEQWASQYIRHVTMRTPERQAPNNHGVAYDVHVATVGLTCMRTDAVCAQAVAMALELGISRVPGQVTEYGTLPRELSRGAPLHYMLYTTGLFVTAANAAETFGLSGWWDMCLQDCEEGGVLMRRLVVENVGYLRLPNWTHKDIGETDMARGMPIFYEAVRRFGVGNGRDGLQTFVKASQVAQGVPEVPDCVFDAPPLMEDTSFIVAFWNVAFLPSEGSCSV